jgi:transposase InsO family protein
MGWGRRAGTRSIITISDHEAKASGFCRENGVDHILTQPRSPTTTAKIERFHRTLRVEFNTRQVFRTLRPHRRRSMMGHVLQPNGIVCVESQHISVGKNYGGQRLRRPGHRGAVSVLGRQ